MKNNFFEDIALAFVLLIAAILAIFQTTYEHARRWLFPALILWCNVFALSAQDLHLPTQQAPHLTRVQRVAIGSGLTFVAGVANGTHEATLHHYGAFQARFQNANPQWWNPQESWVNKYKNNDPEQGAKFPGSMGPLVWTTDAYHLTDVVNRSAMFGGAIVLTLGGDNRPKRILTDALIGALAFGAGHYFTYNLLFK
jgi:hypothetical protein